MTEIHDRATREVWTAYINFRSALRKNDAALALLESANTSYSASLDAYNSGVRNLIDVVTAEKQLAQARLSSVSARSQLFLEAVDLEFVTGNLLRSLPSATSLQKGLKSMNHAPSVDIIGSFFPAWMICLDLRGSSDLRRALPPGATAPGVRGWPSRAVLSKSADSCNRVCSGWCIFDEIYGNNVRKWVGRFIGAIVFAGAIVMLVVVVQETNRHPRTDDANVRANFIEIAPEVNGRLVQLPVKDNSFAKKGTVLFVIDSRPYEYALQQALSDQEALEQQIVDAKRRIAAEGSAVDAARATVDRSGDRSQNRRHRGRHGQSDCRPRQIRNNQCAGAALLGQQQSSPDRAAAAETICNSRAGGSGANRSYMSRREITTKRRRRWQRPKPSKVKPCCASRKPIHGLRVPGEAGPGDAYCRYAGYIDLPTPRPRRPRAECTP